MNRDVMAYATQVAIDAIDRSKYPETLSGDWVEAGVWSRRTLNYNVMILIDADVPFKFIPVDLERRSKSFRVYTKRWSIELFNSVVGTKYAVTL